VVATTNRADRVMLYGVSWEQFEKILENLGNHRAALIAYDNGTLEIMTPLPEHEYFKEVIGDAVKDVADELDIDYASYGSTTWRKQIKMAVFDPDNCFYFQKEAIARGRLDLNLSKGDSPPDLALEIDITHKSLARFPIYARLEVPELWCYNSGELKIYHLRDSVYVEAEIILALSQLPIKELPPVIEPHRAEGQRTVRKAVRVWATV